MATPRPPFARSFLKRLEDATDGAVFAAEDAAYELKTAASALLSVREETAAYETLLRNTKLAVARYEKLNSRADRLRRLLDELDDGKIARHG